MPGTLQKNHKRGKSNSTMPKKVEEEKMKINRIMIEAYNNAKHNSQVEKSNGCFLYKMSKSSTRRGTSKRIDFNSLYQIKAELRKNGVEVIDDSGKQGGNVELKDNEIRQSELLMSVKQVERNLMERKEALEQMEMNKYKEMDIEEDLDSAEKEYELQRSKSKTFRKANYNINFAEERMQEENTIDLEEGSKPERRTYMDKKGKYHIRSNSKKEKKDEILSTKDNSKQKPMSSSKKRKGSRKVKRSRSVKKTKSMSKLVRNRIKSRGPSKKINKIRKKGSKEFNLQEQKKKIRKLRKKFNYESEIEKALASLQENSLPEEILCREGEKSTIREFIKEGVKEKGSSQCLCKIFKKY